MLVFASRPLARYCSFQNILKNPKFLDKLEKQCVKAVTGVIYITELTSQPS